MALRPRRFLPAFLAEDGAPRRGLFRAPPEEKPATLLSRVAAAKASPVNRVWSYEPEEVCALQRGLRSLERRKGHRPL
jgi:hypothetical protein